MSKRFKKGDIVKVTRGNYKGMTGEILQVICKKDSPNERKVVIRGVNMRAKHMKKRNDESQGQKSGIIKKEIPIPASSAVLWNEANGAFYLQARISKDSKKELVYKTEDGYQVHRVV